MANRAVSEVPATSSPTVLRIDSLTSLRFLFALPVFGYHAVTHAPFGLHVFDGAISCVSFFFLLSGFVMSWTARPSDTARAFYLRRFGRIYPAYLTAWVCAMAVLFVAHTRSTDNLVAVTLLQSWIPNSHIFLGASAPFWSLSVEAFLYASFPLVHLVLMRLSMRGLGIAAAVGFALAMVVPLTLLVTNAQSTMWIGAVFPPVRLGEFVLGAAVGAAYLRGFRLRLPWWFVVGVALVGFLTSPLLPKALGYFAYTVIPYGLLIIVFASIDLDGRPNILRHPVFVRLGDYSYAFYLFHAMILGVYFQMALRVGHDATKTAGAFWAVFVLAFFTAIAVAAIVHHHVEAPLAKKVSGWAKRHTR